MATIQSSEVAVHYGQHFVPVSGNPIPGVIAVAADGQYTAPVPIQYRPLPAKAMQNGPAGKPTILNRTLNGAANPVMMKIEQQTGAQVTYNLGQPQPQLTSSKMWLLVEWEVPAGEPNTYSVIDSSELILQSTGRMKETIHTGKTIAVKRGNKVQHATVVIISDDKQFIDTELAQLQKMAAENLLRLSGASQDQHQLGNGNVEQHAKRRRMDEDMEPVSPEYEPMPIQTHLATANWVNNCKPERVISPSPSVISSAVHMLPPQAVRQPPPMTFDQQTQTDNKFFPQENNRAAGSSPPELAKILSLQESILAEQKSVRMENEYNRKCMFNMMEQMSSFADTLKQLVAKVESSTHNYKYEITEVKSPIPAPASYVVLGTGGEESMAESLSQKASNETPADNLMLDPSAMQEESNLSFSNNSRFSTKEDNASATSTPKNQNLNFSKRFSASALSLSNASVHSQHSSTPASDNKSTVREVLKDWADDDGGDENDTTPIGPNNTMVKKQVLRAINWTNYKAATRKLLMTLFTREKLASHTLTGRPSPAFMGDRAKPVKDKLEPTIIADIISIITKSCNVSEPMVRTAITTKCADENKMSRMKIGRSPAAQTTMKQFVNDGSSNSQLATAGAASTSPMAGSHPKRTKRENKENFH